MGNRDMTLSVIVKLRDELGAGLNAALSKITAWSQRVKGAFDRIGAGIGALSQKLGALGIGIGVGLADGLRSATEFDAKLRDVAITYGLVGKAVEDFVKKAGGDTQKLAKDTGQLSQKLVEVRGLLAAANVEQGAADVMVRPIGRAATAAGADAADITKTAIAAFQNSGLAPELLGTALAHMITGGKLGSFELKNMAQHYPSVLAALANLGVKGMGGIDTATAMLQISKRTAGTEGEAATNMLDFLSGLNSAHTVKRFKDKGVDLPGVMADANARGINPVEAVIGKIGKIIDQPKVVDEALARARSKGLDKTKTAEEVRKSVESAVKAAGLGELFVNQQSKMFLMAMLSNLPDYKKMKAEIAGADESITDKDYASRMAGPEGKSRMAAERIEQIMRRFGEAMTGAYERVGSIAEKVQGWIQALDEISPKIVDFGVQIAALAGAIGSIAFVLKMLGFGGGAKAAAETAVEVAGGTAKGVVGTGASAAGAIGSAVASAGGTAVGSLLGQIFGGDGSFTHLADAATRAARALDEFAGRIAAALAPSPAFADIPTETPFPGDAPAAPEDGPYRTGGAFGGERGRMRTGGGFGGPAEPQKVDVGGTITIKVDGPGTVTSTSSSTPGVNFGGDRGQTVGRP